MSNKLIHKGDKLDKYRAHLIEGSELDVHELVMLERYRRAMALLCEGESLLTAVKYLQSESDLSESQLYAIIRDARQLFGNINQVDKEGLKFVHYENFLRLSRKAEDAGDLKTAERAWQNASRLYDLFTTKEKAMALDPAQFLRPTTVVFSTSPSVLRKQQAEDIDYEEADSETDLLP